MFIKQILIWVMEQSNLELHQLRTWHYIYKWPNVVGLGGGYVMVLCTLSLVHVMLLIF